MSEVILIEFPKIKECEWQVRNTCACVKYVYRLTPILLPDLLSLEKCDLKLRTCRSKTINLKV